MALVDKFDECKECRFRRSATCLECDYGEQFEALAEEGLRFDFNKFPEMQESDDD